MTSSLSLRRFLLPLSGWSALSIHLALAAPGDLDTTFNGSGQVLTAMTRASSSVLDLALQTDGMIVAAGVSDSNFAVARYKADGSLDSSFGSGGKVVTYLGGYSPARSVVVQDDGKIVVAGKAEAAMGLVRYRSNGSLDTSFGSQGIVITGVGLGLHEANSVTLQSDGKIVVAGSSYSAGRNHFTVVRHLPDGSLDTTFNGTGKVVTQMTDFGGAATCVRVLEDGKILAGGHSANDSSGQLFALARYLPNGSLDLTFNATGKVVYGADASYGSQKMAIQADGKILMSGSSSSGSGQFCVVRFLATGGVDTAFNGTGYVTTQVGSADSDANSIALQADGKILVSGSAYNGVKKDFALVRYLSNGALDTTFNGTGQVTTSVSSGEDRAYAMILQTDGKIVVGGQSELLSAVVRYECGVSNLLPLVTAGAASVANTSATLVGTINPNGGVTTAEFQYGLTTAYGSSTSVTLSPANGTSAQSVSLPISSLTPGATYHYRLRATNATGTTVSKDQYFTASSPASNATLAGLVLSRGSLNSVFDGATTQSTVTVPYTVSSLTVTPTVEGPGATVRVNEVAVPSGNPSSLIQLNVGTTSISVLVTAQDLVSTRTYTVTVTRGQPLIADPDHGFNLTGRNTTPIGPGNDTGSALALQTDGKILLAGTTWSGTSYDFALVRYNGITGGLDTSLNGFGKSTVDFSAGNDSGSGVAVQSDGKIVVVGTSNYLFALARFNPDGTLDGTFNGTGKVTTSFGPYAAEAWDVAIQSDGKIVVCGTYGGMVTVARYNANGSLDNTFNSSGRSFFSVTTFGSVARGIVIQPDGRIIVGCEAVRDAAFNMDFALVRFHTNGSVDSAFGNAGKVISTGVNGYAKDVALQSDGKILITGWCWTAKGTDTALLRYHADGSPDLSFGNGGTVLTDIFGGSDDRTSSMAVQVDGKILVAVSYDNGTDNDFSLVRYDTFGDVDLSFGIDGKIITPIGNGDDDAQSVKIQNDGKIVVGGSSFNGFNSDFAVVRYHNTPVASLTTLPATGVLSSGATLRGSVNPNGSATTARFEYGATTSYGSTSEISLTPVDGTSGQSVSAVISGLTPGTTYHYRLCSISAGGTSVSTDGTFTTLSINANLVGLSISAGALSPVFDSAITSYSTTVPMMAASMTVTPTVSFISATVKVNGTTVVSGSQSAPIGLSQGSNIITTVVTAQDGLTTKTYTLNAIRPAVPPGSLDAGFGNGGKVVTTIGSADEIARAVKVQADGKILAAGQTFGADNNDFALVRYHANGTLDTSFNGTGKVTTPVSAGDDYGYGLAVQTDGKILVGGQVSSSGAWDFGLVRYNADGSLDTSFNGTGKVTTPIGSSTDIAYNLALQPDGKVLLAGYAQMAGTSDFAVVRYNSDGSLDTSFNGTGKVTTAIGSGEDLARGIALQSDGKIILSGYYHNGVSYDLALVRYNPNGSLDTSFNGTGKITTPVGSNSDYASYSVIVQPDGQILVAGYSYISAGNDNDFTILRYNPDGSLDTSFGVGGKATTAVGSGADTAFGMALQRDGRIFVAGQAFNGSNVDVALVKYRFDGTLDTGFNISGKVMTPVGTGTDAANSITLQADGKVIIAGHTRSATDFDFLVMRYEPGPFSTTLLADAASSLTATGAMLTGTVNPNGISLTSSQFEYGLTSSYGSIATVSVSPINGSTAVPVAAAITGLTPGTIYHYRLSATNASNLTGRSMDSTFITLTRQQDWRQTWFGSASNAGQAADTFDYDNDGLANLIEWCTGQNPTTSSVLPATAVKNAGTFEYTYTRTVAAVNAGAGFIVEWSDTLPGPAVWSTTGVTQQVVEDNGTMQRVLAVAPAGSEGRRFIRLRVTAP